MYGPGTNLASSGSLIFHSECQAHYIVAAITHLADNRLRSAEPTAERTRDWVERSQQQLRGLVWSQPSVKHSFYKNSFGEIYTLSPWRVTDYWTWTREFDPADYLMRVASHPEAKIPEWHEPRDGGARDIATPEHQPTRCLRRRFVTRRAARSSDPAQGSPTRREAAPTR